jgi:hypothetical protein
MNDCPAIAQGRGFVRAELSGEVFESRENRVPINSYIAEEYLSGAVISTMSAVSAGH